MHADYCPALRGLHPTQLYHIVPCMQEGLTSMCDWGSGICSAASNLLSEDQMVDRAMCTLPLSLDLFFLMLFAVRWCDRELFIS